MCVHAKVPFTVHIIFLRQALSLSPELTALARQDIHHALGILQPWPYPTPTPTGVTVGALPCLALTWMLGSQLTFSSLCVKHFAHLVPSLVYPLSHDQPGAMLYIY